MSDRSITVIKGIGEKRAQLFQKLGVSTVDALLYTYPRGYLDLSKPCSPADAPFGQPCALRATVATPVHEARIRRGMTLYRFTAREDGVSVKITLFNNRFAAQKIRENEEYIFYGTVTGGFLNKEMASPEILPVDKAYIRPIYHATAGLPSYVIENAVRQALVYADELSDPLPEGLRKQYHLPGIAEAICAIHFPESGAQLQKARRRLLFEELLTLQCGLQSMGTRNRSAEAVRLPDDLSEEFAEHLPFPLTGAQRRAIREAMADLQSGRQMNRLLQGDVGSGKTAVAACLCYNMAKQGHQAALMAPTEILAEQHFRSLSRLFEGTGIRVALLTGSTGAKERRETVAALADGNIGLLIGTHAILEDSVTFADLGLVITDEQHRFGVNQRKALSRKSGAPHTLVMSATPIPRTLALILYGDLDVSVLDELPSGRQPVQTRAITSEQRDVAYAFIRKQLDKGRQAYIVCPLVEESESDMASAMAYYDTLKSKVFAQYEVGLLHGRMKGKDKDAVMRRFADGEIRILVTTTVVEVGVDVPNATVMMVENADRFGLSQLHQLRGRVGRGGHKSFCILLSDSQSETARQRLQVMCNTNDGFAIAEADLAARGPGDFFGDRQHGLPTLHLADLMKDCEALTFAQSVAKQILDQDPTLSRPENLPLKEHVDAMFREFRGGLN